MIVAGDSNVPMSLDAVDGFNRALDFVKSALWLIRMK
jgi:hypothetical protein